MAAHWSGGHHHAHLKAPVAPVIWPGMPVQLGLCQWPGDKRLGKLLPLLKAQELDSLNAEQLRALTGELMAQVAQRERVIASKDGEFKYRQAKIDQLMHEMAVLKRLASSARAASGWIRRSSACSMKRWTPTSPT